jgi:hypothetical protein
MSVPLSVAVKSIIPYISQSFRTRNAALPAVRERERAGLLGSTPCPFQEYAALLENLYLYCTIRCVRSMRCCAIMVWLGLTVLRPAPAC